MTYTTTLHQEIPDSLPPCNIELEEAILGGLLFDPNAIFRISDSLEPHYFYFTPHQRIYAAIKTLFTDDRAVDLMTVTEQLMKRKQLDNIGGTSKLAQLLERTVSAANIDKYAEIVREKFIRRELINFSHGIQQAGYDSSLPLASIAERIKNNLAELLEPFIPDPVKREYAKYKKLLSQVETLELSPGDPGFKAYQFQQLAERSNRSVAQLKDLFYKSLLAEENEPACSLAELREKYGGEVREWLLHGLLPAGSITLLHALGGVGKTRLGYDIAYHFCEGQDWNGFPLNGSGPVLIVQTDEQPVDLLDNLESRGFKDNHPITIKTRWHADFLANLYQEIDRVRPRFIMIDSLTSIGAGTVSENDVEFARPILLLNKIARDFKCHILLLHHSSKAREGNKGQARGTTAIYNAVSQVWQLTRDSTRPADDPDRLLLIEKSRCRRPATYQLQYNADDRSWICFGETGEDDGNSSLRSRILAYLKLNRGSRFENLEIQEALGGTSDQIRRATSRLANDGLVNSAPSKRNRKSKVYWLPIVTQVNETINLCNEISDRPAQGDRKVIDHPTIAQPCSIEGKSDHPPPKISKNPIGFSEKKCDRVIGSEIFEAEPGATEAIHHPITLSDRGCDPIGSSPGGSDRIVPVDVPDETKLNDSRECHSHDESTEDFNFYLAQADELAQQIGLEETAIAEQLRSRYGCDRAADLSDRELIDWIGTLAEKADESAPESNPEPEAESSFKIGDRIRLRDTSVRGEIIAFDEDERLVRVRVNDSWKPFVLIKDVEKDTEAAAVPVPAPPTPPFKEGDKVRYIGSDPGKPKGFAYAYQKKKDVRVHRFGEDGTIFLKSKAWGDIVMNVAPEEIEKK